MALLENVVEFAELVGFSLSLSGGWSSRIASITPTKQSCNNSGANLSLNNSASALLSHILIAADVQHSA